MSVVMKNAILGKLGLFVCAAIVAFGALILFSAEAQARRSSRSPKPQVGVASYYAQHFAGRRMASGQRFNPRSNSAAHRTWPMGTVARVRNLTNGRSAVVVIRDRGPFTAGRILDVSPRVADALSMRRSGVARVRVTPIRER